MFLTILCAHLLDLDIFRRNLLDILWKYATYIMMSIHDLFFPAIFVVHILLYGNFTNCGRSYIFTVSHLLKV